MRKKDRSHGTGHHHHRCCCARKRGGKRNLSRSFCCVNRKKKVQVSLDRRPSISETHFRTTMTEASRAPRTSLAEVSVKGEFMRIASAHRNWITADGPFTPDAGRYRCFPLSFTPNKTINKREIEERERERKERKKKA
jgi:hypothetical protein